jgi:hypothetical protein
MITLTSLSEDGTYILAQVVGDQSLAMARQGFTDIAALIATTGVAKILFDTRQQRTPMSTADSYEVAQLATQPAFASAIFAVVVPGSLPLPHFIETVASNRGVRGRYFNDYDLALAWLAGIPTGKQD